VLPCARIVIVISQNSSEGTTAGNFRDGDIGAVTFRGVSHASSVDGHLCGTRDLGRRRVQTEEEIVPTVAVSPATPFTSQVTFLLLVLVTVAVNCWVWETESETAGGSTETATSELA